MLTNDIGIYKITNSINNRVYVGSTINGFRKRRNQHFNKLKRNAHENSRLQNSYNKHGRKVFEFTVIETVPKNSDKGFVIGRETYYYNQLDKTTRYNLKDPMPSGEFSKETRAKMSMSHNKRKKCVARICLISFNILQIHESINASARYVNGDASTISKVIQGKNKTAYGFSWVLVDSLHDYKNGTTTKEKAVLREKTSPKWNTTEKGVYKIDIYTGQILAQYKSIKFAGESMGRGHSANISRCVNGKAKTAYGYIWRFV